MKFLCDVHISYKIVNQFRDLGFESIHVNEILNKSETKDSEISLYADKNDYVVITKDSDFRDTYFIKKTPRKLIKINLGNISNNDLLNIFKVNIDVIKKLENRENFIIEIDDKDINILE